MNDFTSVNPLILAGAVGLAELAEDLGLPARWKPVTMIGAAILIAALLFLAPAYPWLWQIGGVGLFGGLFAAGLLNSTAGLKVAPTQTVTAPALAPTVPAPAIPEPAPVATPPTP